MESVEGAGVMLETKLIGSVVAMKMHDPEWIKSTLSNQRQRCFVLYREHMLSYGGHMLLPKKLSKSTRFKAITLPPAGDELLGNLRRWKTLVFSCSVTVCQHRTKPWPLVCQEALCQPRFARWWVSLISWVSP